MVNEIILTVIATIMFILICWLMITIAKTASRSPQPDYNIGLASL